MFNYYKHAYGENDHSYRDATISRLRQLLNIVWQMVPILAVLKMCKVIEISWLVIGLVWIGYEVLEYGFDLLEIWIHKKDTEKRREILDEMCRQKREREYAEDEDA